MANTLRQEKAIDISALRRSYSIRWNGGVMARKSATTLVIVLVFIMSVGCDTGPGGTDSWPDLAVYSLGDQGPAGGIVFYDKGDRSDGWRYLEAAPEDQGQTTWGPNPSYGGGTERRVGEGLSNTNSFVENIGIGSGYAVDLCVNYTLSGFTDWFLPSLDELLWLYERQGLIGGFSSTGYWSSTEAALALAWFVDFGTLAVGDDGKGVLHNVRAIRRF
jgi:hypothetical protein